MSAPPTLPQPTDPQAAAAAPAVPLPSLPVLPVHVDPAAGGNAPADAAAPPADSTTTDPAATAPPTARPKPPPAKPAPGAPPRADASVTLVAEGAAWADGKLTLHNASPTAVAVSDRRPGVPSRALAASFAADVPADTVVDALLLGSSADGGCGRWNGAAGARMHPPAGPLLPKPPPHHPSSTQPIPQAPPWLCPCASPTSSQCGGGDGCLCGHPRRLCPNPLTAHAQSPPTARPRLPPTPRLPIFLLGTSRASSPPTPPCTTATRPARPSAARRATRLPTGPPTCPAAEPPLTWSPLPWWWMPRQEVGPASLCAGQRAPQPSPALAPHLPGERRVGDDWRDGWPPAHTQDSTLHTLHTHAP